MLTLYSGDHLIIFYMKSTNAGDAFGTSILLEMGNLGGSAGNENSSERSHLSKKCLGGCPKVYLSIYICSYSHLAGNKGVPVYIS